MLSSWHALLQNRLCNLPLVQILILSRFFVCLFCRGFMFLVFVLAFNEPFFLR